MAEGGVTMEANQIIVVMDNLITDEMTSLVTNLISLYVKVVILLDTQPSSVINESLGSESRDGVLNRVSLALC